jgi:phosphoglycerate kinase
LIPQCNHLEYITAICRETGKDANYSKRNTDDKEEEIIGGADIYSAADRETFFGPSDAWYHDSFTEYAKLFCEKRGIKLSDQLTETIKTVKVDNTTNYKKLISKLTSDSLRYANLRGKRIILRMDLNRLDNRFKTIKFIINRNPEKLIIIGHANDEDGVPQSVEPIREHISKTLGLNIKLWQDINSPVPENQIVMLENIQFYQAEMILNEQFSKQLTKLCDVYVNDAFNASHQKHTSIVGINAPERYQGFAFKREVKYLSKIFNRHERKVLLVADSQVNTDLFMNMLTKVNSIIVGGPIAISFMKCIYGMNIGNSVCNPDDFERIPEIIERAKMSKVSIYLPIDFVCINTYDGELVTYPDKPGIPKGYIGIDVGQDTVDYYTAIISDANVVIWAGIFGTLENKFNGTRFIMNNLADMEITKVLVGDELANHCHKLKLEERFNHISVGDNGMRLLEGKTLPGIEFIKHVN